MMARRDRVQTTWGTHVLPLDGPDYRLRWPRALFVDELRAVMSRPDHGQGSAGALLLREAFVGTAPVEAFDADILSGVAVLAELKQRSAELAEGRATRAPYRIEKVCSSAAEDHRAPDWDGAMRKFVRLFDELDGRGYFDLAWGEECVDGQRDEEVVRDYFEVALGLPDVWPFAPASWSEDVFLSVVEVVHEAAARPRALGRYHSFSNCGQHFASYAPTPGQAVFRFRMGHIFEESRVPFRLVDSGAEYGRVVALTDSAREDLLTRAVTDAPPDEATETAHAIALFRSHGATREAKRSAVATLARILEQNRALLRRELLSKDEGALFTIANTFDIRHSSDKQQGDYDEAFLDWIFWWFLGTVELLNRLRARASTARA